MRWSALGLTIATACSTAPLAGQNGSFDTFDSVGESAGTSGDASTGDEASTTTDPTSPTEASDPSSDPTVAPDSSGEATTDPTDATTSGESSSSDGGEESTGMTTVVEESSSDSAPMESSDSGPDPLACSDGDLGMVTGNAVSSGSNVGAIDDLTLSCASGGGADDVFLWTAPAANTYTFDLSGSSYDTALGIFDPDCGGSELACNDDSIGLTSAVTIDLVANQQVLVSIEGYSGATGSWVLDINTGAGPDFSCADGGDLGSATGNVASGTTVGAVDDWAASCASDGPDVAFAWTAPSAAVWTFSLVGSSYDTVITLQSPDCAGSELACNDDFSGLQSETTANLAAGESVIVVVDGYNSNSGNYTLAIN